MNTLWGDVTDVLAKKASLLLIQCFFSSKVKYIFVGCFDPICIMFDNEDE